MKDSVSRETESLLARLAELAAEFQTMAVSQAEVVRQAKAGSAYLRDISSKAVS